MTHKFLKNQKSCIETFVSLSSLGPTFTCVRCHICGYEIRVCRFDKDKHNSALISVSLMVQVISGKLTT